VVLDPNQAQIPPRYKGPIPEAAPTSFFGSVVNACYATQRQVHALKIVVPDCSTGSAELRLRPPNYVLTHDFYSRFCTAKVEFADSCSEGFGLVSATVVDLDYSSPDPGESDFLVS